MERMHSEGKGRCKKNKLTWKKERKGRKEREKLLCTVKMGERDALKKHGMAGRNEG